MSSLSTREGTHIRTIVIHGFGRSRWQPWRIPHEYGLRFTVAIDTSASDLLVYVDEALRACDEYETEHNIKPIVPRYLTWISIEEDDET